jgi:hypothetical protein
MRPSKLSDEQIVALRREAEKGEQSIAVPCREVGVAEVTFSRRRSRPP